MHAALWSECFQILSLSGLEKSAVWLSGRTRFSDWAEDFHSHLSNVQGPLQVVCQLNKTCLGQANFESCSSKGHAKIQVIFRLACLENLFKANCSLFPFNHSYDILILF